EQFAMGASLGRQRHGGGVGEGYQPVRKLFHHLQRALHGRDRLQRVDIGKAGQAGHLLVEARIVLHRARAERIHAAVDRVVEAGEAHIVTHRFGFGQPGKIERQLAREAAQTLMRNLDIRQVDTGMLGVADLEQQRLIGQQGRTGGGVEVRGDMTDAGRAALVVHAHASSSERAAQSATISASVVSSVAASTMRLATDGSPGSSRLTGTPARMPRTARRSTSSAPGFDVRIVISLKKVLLSTSTPSTTASASASLQALAWLRRARRVKPASPSRAIWIEKASAQRPELVQILLVAFSRRICCSRVLRVSTKPRCPSASTVSPQIRPGIWRMNSLRVARSPR